MRPNGYNANNDDRWLNLIERLGVAITATVPCEMGEAMQSRLRMHGIEGEEFRIALAIPHWRVHLECDGREASFITGPPDYSNENNPPLVAEVLFRMSAASIMVAIVQQMAKRNEITELQAFCAKEDCRRSAHAAAAWRGVVDHHESLARLLGEAGILSVRELAKTVLQEFQAAYEREGLRMEEIQ